MENIKEIDKTRYVKFNAMGELALALILHPQVWRWGVHDFGNKEGLFLRFKVSGDHFQGWVYIGANTNDLFDIFFVKRFGQISFVLTDVHKNEKYNAWLQLDFGEKDERNNHKVKQYTTGYGFDLEKTLENYPIKGMQDSLQKERLLQSLEKGNRQEVTFLNDGGREEKMFIEARPQFKKLDVYDSEMRRQVQGYVNVNNITIRDGKKQQKEKKEKQQTDTETPKKKQGRRKGLFGLR